MNDRDDKPKSRLSIRNLLSICLLSGMLLLGLFLGLKHVAFTYELMNETFPGFLVNERMLINNTGRPSWAGKQAGLHYPDKILSVDGEAVSTAVQLLEVVRLKSPGTIVTYTLEKEGETLDVSVPAMLFTGADYITVYGLQLLIALFFSVVGIVVFTMKYNTTVSWIFLFGCYCISLVFLCTLPTPLFIRVYLVFAVLELAAAMHFGMHFPSKSRYVERYPWIQAIPYLIALLLILSIQFYYPDKQFQTFWVLRQVFEVLALVVVVGAILRDFIRPLNILARQRAHVLLWGVMIAFPLPVAAVTSQILFGSFLGFNVDVVWASIPLLLFPLAIAYSIVRHNLFDADAYVKRTVGYILMTIILASGYLGLQSGVRHLFDPVFGDLADKIYPVLYAIMVVFLFNPVNVRIQAVIDKLFYRKEYDFKEVVQGAERSLASVLDINSRMQRLVNILKETLFLEATGLVIYADGDAIGDTYFETDTEETDATHSTSDFRIDRVNPLVDLVMREGRLITRFDIEEDKRYSAIKDDCLEQYNNLDASICLPLFHNDETFGVVFLGNKKSGKFFNNQDIDLVKLVSARGAVAIDNALLVEQMKKEEEVRGNLARYLSPEIVDRVLSHGMEVNLGGQRKVVSVMFSDIRDFTTISEAWPPDQLVTILNEYMTEMVAIVFKHKGSIDKFVGDAIVAVFGSLIELEDHAACAVKAVFDMQEKLKELNVRWQDVYGVDMKIGCGINTGEVFLGNIGSPDRMEFTVIGDAVNLSARLEGLTKYYGVGLVVSEFTKAGFDGIVCRKLDRVLVKGKRKAVEIYEPVCLVADADDQLRSELDSYDKALGHYYEQRWDEANAILTTLHNQYPERKIYSLYLERIETLRDAGLAADWDGSFVHTSK